MMSASMTLATVLYRLAVDPSERSRSTASKRRTPVTRGAPTGATPMACVVWTRFLRHAPTRPDWPDRDRFVLSPGHASMLRYSPLHLTGYRRRVSVEVGVPLGWERWVGDDDAIIGLDHCGASAPAGTSFEKSGFTPERVTDVARRVVRDGLHGRMPTLDGGHQE